MFIVSVIFAALGISCSLFVAAMFVLNQKAIDLKATEDAQILLRNNAEGELHDHFPPF